MVILLNMRVFNIIHKHLLNENKYNDQTIEIRSGCVIHNKGTPVFSPCRIFLFLMLFLLNMCS